MPISQRTTGTLIDATIWNEIVDAINLLNSLEKDGTPIGDLASGTEIGTDTDLFAYHGSHTGGNTSSTSWQSLAAGTVTALGFTPDALIVHADFHLNNSNSTHQSRARIQLTSGTGTVNCETMIAQAQNGAGLNALIDSLDGDEWEVELQYSVNNGATTATVSVNNITIIPYVGG